MTTFESDAVMDSIFPITKDESDALHAAGWSSGYGWEREFDWYHEPSMGTAIFVEDDEKMMNLFLSDLGDIRREEARRVRVARLHSKAEEMYETLADLLDDYDEERQAIAVEPDPGCIDCTVGTTPDDRNTGLCAFHRAWAIVAVCKP